MDLAPWRSPLARALHRNRSLPEARYFQLATVRPNGHPANRTMVFRGFAEQSNSLQTVTDARSEKREQLRENPWAEVCWYFTKTREQFRLLGSLQLVSADTTDPQLVNLRQQLWHDLSDKVRAQFAWEHPGNPRHADTEFVTEVAADTAPLADFCVLLLHPVFVDHLELRGDPQNRTRYEKQETGWTSRAVNP